MSTNITIFCSRAAQKLNLNSSSSSSSPHRRKRHSSEDEDYPIGGFSGVIQRTPPPVPPALLRRIGVKEISSVGKVSSYILFMSTNKILSSISGVAKILNSLNHFSKY